MSIRTKRLLIPALGLLAASAVAFRAFSDTPPLPSKQSPPGGPITVTTPQTWGIVVTRGTNFTLLLGGTGIKTSQYFLCTYSPNGPGTTPSYNWPATGGTPDPTLDQVPVTITPDPSTPAAPIGKGVIIVQGCTNAGGPLSPVGTSTVPVCVR